MLGRCVTGNQGSNDDVSNFPEIYTEWANYYLERAKSKRTVTDLSTDCRDGLLLAEVIEAVTTFKVPDLIKKPKTQQQMYDNVEACLGVLRQNQVGGLESITATEICNGRLKAVLSLFFSLSRYKQASKLRTPSKTPQTFIHHPQIHQQPAQHLNISTEMRQLPVPYNKTNGGATSIPLPATVLVTRRTPDKRSLPVPNGQSGIVKYPSGTPSSESSRPNSPPDFKSGGIRFQPNCKIPPSPYNVQNNNGALANNEIVQQAPQQSNGTTKHSMLDKLKLFKDKDRSKSSKRTSSSSGFSSARSDSSLSLNNDSSLPAPAKSKKGDAASSSKASSKASKLLSSKVNKETTSCLPPPVIKAAASKVEKKDKVKAVEVNVENPSASLKLQKVKFQQPQPPQAIVQQNDSKLKQQQPVRKVEIRNDTKTLSTPPQLQPKAIIQPVTSIPKPMAAIKGTTKQTEFKKDEHFDVIKMNGTSHNGNISVGGEQKTQVVNPLHNQLFNANGTNASSQSMTDSIHSASTNNHSHSNSSESSVIYRPSATDTGSEFYHSNVPMQHRNPIPNRKLDHFNDPLLTNGHKFNTIPSKLNGSASNGQMATTIFEEDKQQGPTIPLRSIMRNYNNHVTLPTRGARGGQQLVNGYYEENGQGYCSDGDALRKTPIRYTDVENGYLSEGGGVTNPTFMSIFRNRPQLPTTIEERCRTGKEGNLESPEMDPSVGVYWSDGNHQRAFDKSQSQAHARRNGVPKSRTKGVPQNFGYIKRTNGSSTATEMQTNAMINGGRTAHVSAVPRSNKIKVSGGTQTGTGDFQQKSNLQYKSYSLTGQCATQLSQSVKERSTKSEKMYPSMLSRGPLDIETEPYYCLPVSGVSIPWSQPTSPTPRGLSSLLSPTHSHHRLIYQKKNDEAHGSQLSLMSGSSMYGSTTEEQRQANEVRRLKRELSEAREQVMSLSSQLSTNAHVVNAFEKSLATMTNRLQTLTATTEKKESEITDMRQTIELLKKQSIQAGLTSAHMQSMGQQVNGKPGASEGSPSKRSLNGSHEAGLQNGNGTMQRHHSTDSVCSINSIGSSCSGQDKKKKKGWLRSSFTKAFSRNAKISKTPREMSLNESLSESKTSLPPTPQKLPPRLPSTHALPDYGKPPISPTKSPHRHVTLIENAKPVDSIEIEAHPVVEDLKKQLREKDMVLTDIRLEALTQASQMETLKETVKAMRQEMMALKHNNDRLQKMVVTTRSLGGSETSIGCPASPLGSGCDSRRYSFATDSGHSRPPLDLPQNLDETEEEDNIPPAPAPNASLSPHSMHDLSPALERVSLSNDVLTTPAEEVADPVDGKKIAIAVFLGQSETFNRFVVELNESEQYDDDEDGLHTNGDSTNGFSDSHDDPSSSKTVIAYTYISGKTTWQNLDYIVRKTFKDYLSKIDPSTNLGLNTDSITSYHLGEAKRGPEMGFPELLPCGYIIGNVKTLYICLQGVGSLAFDTLIPRSIVHRYINLLTEHRRLILCGPSGTGKSHLARKLAEFLVAKMNRSSPAESIATFNVDHKSSQELQQYLSHIAAQAPIAVEELPSVIILDNLHHASALGDVFSCLLSAGPATKLPCIIGTMSQATCNTTNLQLHHNFRWVLTANHMEPVKGFLGRFLRRRLFDIELQEGSTQVQMEKIFRWLPTVLHHINSFLETHSSSDVTIGPQLFLECPLDVNESQRWFVDLWNNHLAPYLVDAIKEGVQLYGRRGNAWIDPCQYVRETYPWNVTPTTVPKLRTIIADDVGLEAESSGNKEDPLLNMLNQLKEAASWNEGHQDDSDCVSLDSNFTHDSSAAEP